MTDPTETLRDNIGSSTDSPSTHSPICMWIGCCDARVPESVLPMPTSVGEVFTHRNIANMFQDNDTNTQGAFGFAMSDINKGIVNGHTDCGGVKASYDAAHNGIPIPGPLGKWLEPLIALSSQLGPNVRGDALAIENIQRQFNNIARSDAFMRANRGVALHGRLYKVVEKEFDSRFQLDTKNQFSPIYQKEYQ